MNPLHRVGDPAETLDEGHSSELVRTLDALLQANGIRHYACGR